MANPQVENGHIDIANKIAEALAKAKLSAGESQILWVVFRKTYGWHKKEDAISLSQFEKETNLSRPHTCHAIKKLVNKNILLVNKNGLPNKYRFNKDFDQWIYEYNPLVVKEQALVKKQAIGSYETGNRVVKEQAHTKETYTKETIQKKMSKLFPKNSLPYQLATRLKEKIKARDPTTKVPKNLQAWALAADRLLRLDSRAAAEVEKVIDFCQEDDFWQANILSMPKLREKYDQLKRQMERRKKYGKTAGERSLEQRGLRIYRKKG